MLLHCFSIAAILNLPAGPEFPEKSRQKSVSKREKEKREDMNEKKISRISRMTLGIICIGIGSGLFRYSGFGADPFTTMNLGLSALLHLSFGTWQLIMNLLLFVPVLLWGRKTIGIGTVFNMILVGYLSDGVLSGMNLLLAQSCIPMRLLILLLAMIIASFGVACYIIPELGVAPYDALQLMIEQYSGGKVSYRAARISCDALSIIAGIAALLAAGGDLFSLIGIGTICNVLLMGPVIQFFKDRMSRSEIRQTFCESGL